MSTAKRFNRDLLPPPLAYYRKEGIKLYGSRPWRSARCPFHDDKNPSLSIHVPSGGFNCHGCGAKGGDVLAFHRLRYSLGFVKAATDLGAWQIAAPSKRSVRKFTPAQMAAQRFAAPILKAGYKSEALHEYRDADGRPLYWRIRAKHPGTGDKWLRPMHFDGRQFVLREPQFSDGKPLYGLHLLTARPNEAVVVSEGEKCADALRKRGLLAITSGCAKSARRTNWHPVAGREILIWPDHDEPGFGYSHDVMEIVQSLGCSAKVIDTVRLGLADGEDAVDWLNRHPGAKKDDILRLPTGVSVGEPASRDPGNANVGITLLKEEMAIISSWCAERCLRNERAWGGIPALYRDFCSWHGPDFAFALSQFEAGLAALRVQVESGFAKGLVLREDL